MDLATIRPLLQLWDELDLLCLRLGTDLWNRCETGAFLAVWESTDPAIRKVWERLTHPKNLSALEHWAIGVESFNSFAKACTLRALAECRSRKSKQDKSVTT